MATHLIVLLSLIEFVVGIVAAGVAVVGWQYRDTRAADPLVVMAVGTSLYAFSAALLSFVTDPLWWRLVNNISYPFGASIAVGSFFVVAEFTEQERLLENRVRFLLVGFVGFDAVVSMTDPIHNQMISSQQTVQGVVVGTAGPLFWVHTIVSLGIVFVATGICLATLFESSGIYRRQSQAVLGAFSIGIAGFVWQSIAPVHPAIDLAAVGMLGWSAVILWGIFVADFLDIVPVGRARVVESIDDPVVMVDDDSRVIDSNPAARQLVDAGANWQAMPVSMFFDSYPSLVEQIKSEDSGRVTLEKSGATRHFDVTLSPIEDGGAGAGKEVGSPNVCVVILRDITDRKQYETRIETQNRRLERLAQVISHDLQTPLSTAEKHLRLIDLELADPPEAVEQSLADLEVTHESLRQFTAHLPRLARESTNVQNATECSLATVARDAWQVTETGSLRLEIGGDHQLAGDPQRLQQLFENLFSNVVEHAVDDAENGKEATTVWVETHENGFAVADDGAGVGAGDEIFEYGMSTGDGSSIGLAISRSIVEAHGWSITVEERDGGGARFVISTTNEAAIDTGSESYSSRT